MKGQFPKSKTICPQSQSRSKNNSVQLKDYLSEDRQDRYKQKAHVYNNKRDKSVHNMSTIEVASLPPLCRNTFSIKRKEEEALERLLSLKKRNTKYSSKRVTTEYPQ